MSRAEQPDPEAYDHYKDQAVNLPPHTQIEVDGVMYVVTTGGTAYSPRLRMFLADLIYRYNFNILWQPGRYNGRHTS